MKTQSVFSFRIACLSTHFFPQVHPEKPHLSFVHGSMLFSFAKAYFACWREVMLSSILYLWSAFVCVLVVGVKAKSFSLQPQQSQQVEVECSRVPEGKEPWPINTLSKSDRSWSLQNAISSSRSMTSASYPRNHITFTAFCEPITNDKAHWLCTICCD